MKKETFEKLQVLTNPYGNALADNQACGSIAGAGYGSLGLDPEMKAKMEVQQEELRLRQVVNEAVYRVEAVAMDILKNQNVEPEIAMERAERFLLCLAEYKNNAFENVQKS